jgi:hypothetical protein
MLANLDRLGIRVHAGAGHAEFAHIPRDEAQKEKNKNRRPDQGGDHQ